mgnify:CR=1 FL=1|jgi:hypothetical protein
MADWEFKAYDAEENVHYGQETASSFPELALKIRQQRSLQIIEATKLNKDGTLAAQRLAKMRARVDPPEPEVSEQQETPKNSAIRRLLSWVITLLYKRLNDQV